LNLLRASLPSFIEIRENIGTGLGIVLADPTQIHQVLMNLCTNAHHAMLDGDGILEVTLEKRTLDAENTLKYPAAKPGSYLCLTVADTGTGIAPEIRNRIFDPYFTTKNKDKGTGLGLSVVQGIIQSHSGLITMDSTPGKGTVFKVFLPIVKRSARSKETESPEMIPFGHERILIVDDEEPIVRQLQRSLEHLGYKVTARTSSIEALEALHANPQSFDLVITDMTMPNLTGDLLAMKIRKIRSDMPVILCTGFSEKITQEKASAIGIDAFLMKPVDRNSLARGIRKVFDEYKQNTNLHTGKIFVITDDDQRRKIIW
jgi:CheY-like chemotaxis protein